METAIQKEQNAIRRLIIFLIFIVFYSPIFSQSLLNNTYSHCYGVVDNGTCVIYNFKENGIFEKDVEGELGKTSYAKGHYIVKNDSLVLNYDLTELKYESYFKAQKYFNTKDSIEVR